MPEPVAHLADVSICLTLVGRRLEEDCLGKGNRDIVFQTTHVEGAALETVDQHKEVQAVVLGLQLVLYHLA